LAIKEHESQEIQRAKEEILALPPSTSAPIQNVHLLGSRITDYLDKSSAVYDPEFERRVRLTHPEWFTSSDRKATAATNKASLLALPLGSPRPGQDTVLGRVLSNYVSPAAKTFDADFRASIRKRFPNWFRAEPSGSKTRKPRRTDLPNRHTQGAQERKAALLAMAEWSPRPAKNTPLGRALTAYTTPCQRERFDADFLRQVSRRFPHWFR
jgi:hypothetical protein